MDADRAAEEAVGAAFAAAIDVAIATPSPSARLDLFWRVFDAIRANRVPAFVVVGGAVLPPTTAPALTGVRAGVVPPPYVGLPRGGAVFRSRPPRRPAVSRLLVLVPAVGVLVVRSGVALLSLAVLAVLLLGRSGRSAAVSVRAAAALVLPFVLVSAVLFLSVGGLSGGRGVLRRG
ncbi:hypothetical protein BU14_0724s0005 [Porphyra umbilicalis]|uniref:Uncharacterized protein n=1 Tax=Porphyra umbilicalis TaxID=2786 RepID=A0A1X6NPM9_PORUM|nr:hypothetical protein BU14_0724s0005 [Porphyra umbilicalis]|eukprot:OSX70547.1 hypothetical protein BU14_0724s0005 [Porphyra umbilicalis]